MSKVIGYLNVIDGKDEEVEARVKDLLLRGWIPQGGLKVFQSKQGHTSYIQTMIKLDTKIKQLYAWG